MLLSYGILESWGILFVVQRCLVTMFPPPPECWLLEGSGSLSLERVGASGFTGHDAGNCGWNGDSGSMSPF